MKNEWSAHSRLTQTTLGFENETELHQNTFIYTSKLNSDLYTKPKNIIITIIVIIVTLLVVML